MDVPTEQQKELTKRAKALFLARDFDGTLKVLDQLQKSKENDASILLNLAVTKYHQSGLTRTDELIRALKSIAHSPLSSSLEQYDTVVQNPVLFYNYAVIMYHTRRFRTAISIADALSSALYPSEEAIYRKVLLLQADLCLHTQQADQALRILTQLEKLASSSRDTSDADRARICLYKLRAGVDQCSMKICRKETKALQALHPNSASALLLWLRTRQEVGRGHVPKAMRLMQDEVRRLASGGVDFPASIRHNTLGILFFLLKKNHLAANSFKHALNEDQKMNRQTFGNNKPSTTLSGPPLTRLGASRQHEIVYNLGVQLVTCGRPLAAFDCLLQSVSLYSTNPRLWLRLAECCVMVHKESNDQDRSVSERQKVIRGVVGSGTHRKLLIGTGTDRHSQPRGTNAAMPMPTLEFASLCLKNALNLLPVWKEGSATVSVPAPPCSPMRPVEVENLRCSILAQSAYVCLCLHDYVRAKECASLLLKQPRLSPAHRYLGHMYRAEACVWLDDVGEAIRELKPDSITEISTTPPDPVPDENEEAWEGRRPAVPGPNVCHQWAPRELHTAKSIMLQNLASAYTMRGELEKGHKILLRSLQIVPSQNNLTLQAFSLKLYLDLMEGRKRTAFNILKDHFGHALSL